MSDKALEDALALEPGWSLTVDPEGDGERLDRFIARRVPRLSRARASRLEVIDLDHPHRSLKKSNRLHVGQRLWARRPPPEEDLSALDEPVVLFEGEGLLVLDKPPGWAAHPTASRFEATITTWLKRRGTPATPAHRLDVETSGVLACASDPEVERALKAAFKAHRVRKVYLAICEGVERTDRGQTRQLRLEERWVEERPLGFDVSSEVRLKMGVGDLTARTDFEVLALSRDVGESGRALIKATPYTGRQHQIRAHLSLSALPIVGDKLYGPDEAIFLRHLNDVMSDEDWARLGHSRQALHASELSCEVFGRAHHWRAPLPESLSDLMAPLERTETTATTGHTRA